MELNHPKMYIPVTRERPALRIDAFTEKDTHTMYHGSRT